LLWAFSAFFFFQGKPKIKTLNTFKYQKHLYFILFGVLISMFSAYFFWGQGLLTTFIAQRFVFNFVLLFALLYVQPNINDIKEALKWISLATIIIGLISIIIPQIVVVNESSLERHKAMGALYMPSNGGIKFVVLYFYFKVEEYIHRFSLKSFSQALGLLFFIFFYQNRSLLIGAVLVLFYSFFKFKSKYKTLYIVFITLTLIGAFIYTSDLWQSLYEETNSQLNDIDYNRWKAFYYFFYEYSPNWFCYIFGNGFSSNRSAFGQLVESNFDKGIYAADLGMIGMWTTYGLIPLIAIYSIIVKIIRHKSFPWFLKFISFHILFIPTIFQFWYNPDILLFVIIFYSYAYCSVSNNTATLLRAIEHSNNTHKTI
jgi:hypothetical protein